MWMRMEGNIVTGVKYVCTPEKEYIQLQAEIDKLKSYIQKRQSTSSGNKNTI
jgi:hypothetical protein